jgi:hypothetical protein
MPTATGLRISSVNGTAFLDNCPADILAAAGTGAQIKIYDASSRYLQGVIDSVGSSEGLTEKITNGNFSSDEPPGTAWVRQITWTVTGGKAVSTLVSDVYSQIHQALSGLYLLGLYKITADIVLTSGTMDVYHCPAGTRIEIKSSQSLSVYTTMFATTYPYLAFRGYTGFEGTVDNASFSQVTAPSSSGVIIKDLSGNQNFISKDENFTYNAASYPYEIINVATASQSVFLKKIFQKGF